MQGNRVSAIRSISVVMCTYNGEKYLREQLDSIIRQTYSIHELIVQDDCSTDGTCSIIEEYAQKYPIIKFFRNKSKKGINQNFFSAMQHAQGELIAISDQDDIWEDNKLEIQVKALGDKMCCASKSRPFASENGISVSVDMRPINYNLLRLTFVGMIQGHTMLITKSLLDTTLQLSSCFPPRFYDIILALVAAAYNSIVYISTPLVRHRRHFSNATQTYFNASGNKKTIKNLLHAFQYSWHLYHILRPQITKLLKSHESFFSKIPTPDPILREALKAIRLYSSRYFIDFLRLSFFCARHGHLLCFAQKNKSLSTWFQGFVFPIYSATYYRFLLK